MAFTVGQHVRAPSRRAKIGETPEGEPIWGELPTFGTVEATVVHEGHAMVLVVDEAGNRKHWHEDELVAVD